MTQRNAKQYLGAYLKSFAITNIEISQMTGILPTRLSKVSNSKNTNLKASEFYLIALALDVDMNEMANHVYSDYKLSNGTSKVNVELTEFGKFLSNGLLLQKTVSLKTGIAQSRLSNLSTDNTTIPYAKEVFLAALAIDKSPSEAFKFICGHLKLKTKEDQEIVASKRRKTR